MDLNEVIQYLVGAFEAVKPNLTALGVLISYVLFPTEAFVAPAIALIASMCLDILTKYYAVCRKHGGFYNALKTRKLSSARLWEGSSRKFVVALVIMIFAGLAYRIAPALPLVKETIIFLATVVYIVMFFREWQSILENLIDAGYEAELGWLYNLLKRKEQSIIDQAHKQIGGNNDDKPKKDDNK